MSHTSEKHWMYQWFDELSIHSMRDFGKAIKSRSNILRLEELREQDEEIPLGERNIVGQSVIAGQRIDLSGSLGCGHFECVSPQIEYLFSRMWHYFDSVTIDTRPIRLQTSINAAHYKYNIEQRVRLLLHLREIGAEHYLNFVPKPHPCCPKHFHENAKSSGVDIRLGNRLKNRLIARLIQESHIDIKRDAHGWWYGLHHERLDSVYGHFREQDVQGEGPTPEMVAERVIGRYCNSMVADIMTARHLGLPILQALEPFWFRAEPPEDSRLEQAVALQIRLPVLLDVPAKELLRIRKDEWPDFEKFRAALRVAIREQLERNGERPPAEIAQAVVDEYIVPELVDIERKIKAAARNLGRKISTNIALGGAATSIGMMVNTPLVIASGVAAIAASVAQSYKFFDDKSEIEMSDLYFLWQAATRHKG